jgi:hypothetical protein
MRSSDTHTSKKSLHMEIHEKVRKLPADFSMPTENTVGHCEHCSLWFLWFRWNFTGDKLVRALPEFGRTNTHSCEIGGSSNGNTILSLG